jgi:hypothetical protein
MMVISIFFSKRHSYHLKKIFFNKKIAQKVLQTTRKKSGGSGNAVKPPTGNLTA